MQLLKLGDGSLRNHSDVVSVPSDRGCLFVPVVILVTVLRESSLMDKCVSMDILHKEPSEEDRDDGGKAQEEELPAQAYAVDMAKPDKSDPIEFLQVLAAKVDTLVRRMTATEDGDEPGPQRELVELQALAADMGDEDFFRCLRKNMENLFESKQAAVVVPTGGQPLKFWESAFWVKQFQDLFCYGDGAYGLNRRKFMSLQEWGAMMMCRTELQYMPVEEPVDVCCSVEGEGRPQCDCPECANGGMVRAKTAQPRWSANTAFRFVVYDCWRRSEIMKKARMHVRKKGFQQNLKLVARTSAEHLRSALSALGATSSLHQLARDDRVEPALRRAVKARCC